MRILPLIAATLFAATALTPAASTTLTVGSGWQSDETDDVGVPSINSPWQFTLTGNGVFSVVDCCIPGDIYTLSGSVSGVTTFFAGAASDVQATGDYGSYWTDATFSKGAFSLGAGTYSISISGDCAAGCPSGLGVRLDAATVPEPKTWGLMLLGFGISGYAMRRRVAVTA